MRILSVFLFLIGSVAECLKIYKVVVPHHALNGKSATLKCQFNLDNKELLYAVKWYKDNEEFFRYVPRFKPTIVAYAVEGIHVDEERSSNQMVTLNPVSLKSTGVYRCEVSAEAPNFRSAQGEGRMIVLYLPTEEPQIIRSNLKDEYEVGDMLDLQCISSKSSPPATLQWYINDHPITEPWALSRPEYPENFGLNHSSSGFSSSSLSSSASSDRLLSTQLRLRLQLKPTHFGPDGQVKVRCRARIDLGDKSHGSNHFTDNGGSSRHAMQDNGWKNVDNDPRFDSSYQVHDMHDHSSNPHHHPSVILDEREASFTVRSISSTLSNSLQLISTIFFLVSIFPMVLS